MRFLTLFLVVLMAATVNGEEKKKKESGLTKVLRTMFPSTKPKIVKPKRKLKTVKPKEPSLNRSGRTKFIPVDVEWMAKYWELEAAWDYYIPDDDQIWFADGWYYVPIVVFKHYEDMLKTPRRLPTPVPVPSIFDSW